MKRALLKFTLAFAILTTFQTEAIAQTKLKRQSPPAPECDQVRALALVRQQAEEAT